MKTIPVSLTFAILFLTFSNSLKCQNVDLTMDINAGNNSLDIYLTANGASYSTEIFNALTFTIRWPSSASFNMGSISQPGSIGTSYPLSKSGVETTDAGFEHQIFTYSTGSAFQAGTLVLSDGVKTLYAQIDVTGFSPNLDLCQVAATNDTWSGNNSGDFSISIASNNRTGSFGTRSAISTTYTSGTWSPCNITTIKAQVSGGDTVNIGAGTYQYNTGLFLGYTQFNVLPGAALELISGCPESEINLRADANGYAQLLDPNDQFQEESVSGFTMEQYVGNNEGWRHIGGLSNLGSSIPTFSTGGAPLNYGASGNYFYFDPSTFDWTAVSSSAYVPSASANNGRGLAIFLGGTHFPVSNGIISWSTPSSPTFGKITATYNYTGDHNSGQGASYNGWNLFGNWWSADIDYHVYNDGLPFDGYSVWTPTGAQTGSYSSYSESGGGTGAAGRYIAPGQAFWVKGTTGNNGADFTINIGDYTLSGSGTRWHNKNKGNQNPTNKGTLSRIRLNVESLNGPERDATIIIFPGLYATAAYEGKYDVFKQENPSPFPSLYTQTSDQEDLAINGVGPFNQNRVIPVFFKSSEVNESYSINYEKADVASNWGDIYLVDHYAGKTHNLSRDGDYSFTHAAAAPEERFQIQFSPHIGLDEKENCRIKIFSYENTVAISRNQPVGQVQVSIYNLAGQEVFKKSFDNSRLVEINTSLPKGYYVVKAQDDRGLNQSQTVIIQ